MKKGSSLGDWPVEDFSPAVWEEGVSVFFKQAFLDRVSFPLDTYTFVVSVQMEDGTWIQSSNGIVIDIN